MKHVGTKLVALFACFETHSLERLEVFVSIDRDDRREPVLDQHSTVAIEDLPAWSLGSDRSRNVGLSADLEGLGLERLEKPEPAEERYEEGESNNTENSQSESTRVFHQLTAALAISCRDTSRGSTTAHR